MDLVLSCLASAVCTMVVVVVASVAATTIATVVATSSTSFVAGTPLSTFTAALRTVALRLPLPLVLVLQPLWPLL